jgi:uncharacterized protein with PIN domain
MIRRLWQAYCNHCKLEIRTISYDTPTATTTAIDHEIVCADCGKVFVERENFDRIARLVADTRSGEEGE